MKLSKKQPQGASSEASLADRIKKTCAEAEAFIEAKVQEEKAKPEGQSIPLPWLRQNIYAMHRARGCHCRCALSLLGKKE
jgi:hypothetical protein